MKILALETSTREASVAILDDDAVVAWVALDPQKRTAQSLAPTVAALLDRNGWEPSQLELIAVTEGPGSFTGLRIGVASAKAMAYATGAAIVALNTLDVIAAQSTRQHAVLWPVLNAERRQLFAAPYQPSQTGDGWIAVGETRIWDLDAWLARWAPGEAVIGPGVALLRDELPTSAPVEPEDVWFPRASTVGRLAFRRFRAGDQSDVWTLVPRYYRRSAAEEKHDG